MSEVKHTPTPWTTSPCPNGGAILHRGGGNSWEHPQGMLQIVPAEDADFIVRSVNVYDDMLAALRLAQSAISMMIEPKSIKEFVVQHAFARAVEAENAARSAIAKAEGRTP